MITLKDLNAKVEKLRKDFIATKDLKLKDKIIDNIIAVKKENTLDNISDIKDELKIQRDAKKIADEVQANLIKEYPKIDIKDLESAYNLHMSTKGMIANFEQTIANNNKAIDRLVDGLKASLLVKEPEKKN